MAQIPHIKALITPDFLPNIYQTPKFVDIGTYNIFRGESSGEFTIYLLNKGDSDLIVDSVYYIPGFGSPGQESYFPLYELGTAGFSVNNIVSFPLKISPSKNNNTQLNSNMYFDGVNKYSMTPVIKIKFDGKNLSEDILKNNSGFNLQVVFNSNDNFFSGVFDDDLDSPKNGQFQVGFDRVVLQAWSSAVVLPNSNSIIHTKNIHGYFNTPKIKSEGLWEKYIEKRIKQTINPGIVGSNTLYDENITRVTIQEFLQMNDFINNRVFNDDLPETKRVFNRFIDPLPPYDFIWPRGNYYAFNGVRRTMEYSAGSRVDQYYKKIRDSGKTTFDGSLVIDNFTLNRYGGEHIRSGQLRQRREWGFREKILKGFPYFFPKYISTEKSNLFVGKDTPCGVGPVIAGIVTAGSGIFSGIASSANIQYDFGEMQRTVNFPTDVPKTKPSVPTGLIFIQDETGAIGFSLGSDMRYMDSPFYHNSYFAEPSLELDKMHLGSTGVPKADYRQFIREGDLVIIQLGVGLKYWHPVLGTQPKDWESLFGQYEYANLVRPNRKAALGLKPLEVNIPTEFDGEENEFIYGKLNDKTQRSIALDPRYFTCNIFNFLAKEKNKLIEAENDRIRAYNERIRISNKEKIDEYNRNLEEFEARTGEPGEEIIPPPKLDSELELIELLGCDGLKSDDKIGSERYISVTFLVQATAGGDIYYDVWSQTNISKGEELKAISVTFYFRKNVDGTCNCSVFSITDGRGSDHQSVPYVDNWGAHTNRPENNPIESAINDVTGIFGSEEAEDFDTDYLSDTNMAGYVEMIANQIARGLGIQETLQKIGEIQGTSTGVVLAAAIGFPALAPITGLILATAGQWLAGQIGLGIEKAISGYLQDNMYYRDAFVLRSRSFRDGQYPYTTFYPIQEYHPWSSGTPIPIDNGMPYIMSDVFMVDTSERFKAVPKEITCAQLRGIPEDTWKWDPSYEWRVPLAHQALNPKQYDPNFDPDWYSKNIKKEFPGMENIPDTAYTKNSGSQYKGQLVTIKNVTFIEPPEDDYFVAQIASEEEKKYFEEDLKNVFKDLEKWLSEGNEFKKFEIKIGGFPTVDLKFLDVYEDIYDYVSVIAPTIQLISTAVEIYFSAEIKDTFGEDVLNTARNISNELEKYSKYLELLVEGVKRIKEGYVSGFNTEQEINEFLAVKHGIDFRGFRVDSYLPHEIWKMLDRKVGNFNLTDALLTLAIRQASEVLTRSGYRWIGAACDLALGLHNAYVSLQIPKREETNENLTGFLGRSHKFEILKAPAQFPLSLDKKNGGYWWTCPDIPLTNARSHNNDYMVESGGEGEREKFTQLISSNKGTHFIQEWHTDDPDDFGDLFRNNISHIKPRYVKNLGDKYINKYEPFAEIWKPYRYTTDKDVVTEQDAIKAGLRNEFKPIDPDSRFVGNRVYYVKDEKNVVIPIRINSNTEIARYMYRVPTGSVNITGIAWQYSMGTPGMEWDREAYIMQIWPRYLSDVGLEFKDYELPKLPELDTEDRDPDVPVVTPPDEPKGPRKLPDLTLDIGDAGNPARLDCDSVRRVMDSQNQYKEQLKKQSEWPVDREYEQDPRMNVHKDPQTGREILMPKNIKEVIDAMPDYPCKGMKIGEQQTVTVTSQQFPGVVRKFFFMVGPNGECLCTMYQPGTEDTGTSSGENNTSNDGGVFDDEGGNFGNRRGGFIG